METITIFVMISLGVFNLIMVAMLGFQIFILYLALRGPNSPKRTMNQDHLSNSTGTPAKTNELTEEQKIALKKELDAVNELFSYNADVAYGVKHEEETER